MTRIKLILRSLYCRAHDYNLFIPDENDYEEENTDRAMALKHQKYTTRLYVILLIMYMYVLFYATIMKPQNKTIVINHIDLRTFEQLYSEHGDLLSCPCSTITTVYEHFVSHTIQFHPVCSSFFVNQQWITALYLKNRSSYDVVDFRSTASSQFQLLSSLCVLSQEISWKNKIDVNNHELITISALSESKIESNVNSTIEFFKSGLSTRIISLINYLRFVTQGNNFISALNINVYVGLQFFPIFRLIQGFKVYYWQDDINETEHSISCSSAHLITPAIFYSFPTDESGLSSPVWSQPTKDSTFINGFYIGCNVFEALLNSTLDCLYEIDCLQLLNDYFPSVNQMNLNITDFVLLSNKSNLTVYDHLTNLFIEKWTTQINYSAYFHNCNPSLCTYTTSNTINYSYAVNLFISLYGGLILILRFVSPVIIKTILKLKQRSFNQVSLPIVIASCKRCPQQCVQWMKKSNLFKQVDKRTENDIKQQQITTYVYVILLTIAFVILLLFNSLSTQTTTLIVSNPSYYVYIDLEKSHSNTLICPCSTMIISHQKLMSLSPTLHQVCSSDFISERWLSILQQSTTYTNNDWRNEAYEQFSLLSKLCKLANETVTNAMLEFLSQSFAVTNLLSEVDFNAQMKNILDKFFQSTLVYFHHLIDVVNLHVQVDQPFMMRGGEFGLVTTDYFQVHSIYTTDGSQFIEVILPINHINDVYSQSTECICTLNPNCQRVSVILDVNAISLLEIYHNFTYIIPGLIVGCSEIKSLLGSTLECFFSNSTCNSILMNYIKKMYEWNVEDPLWYDIHPLIYNSTSTRFYPNSSISTIIKDIMIEQWNPYYSYENFYQLCAPTNCFYQQRIYTNNTIGIIVILLSMIGGLVLSLRFITPYLIIFINKLISMITKKQEHEQPQQQQQRVTLNGCDRLKSIKKAVIRSLFNVLVNLNIFSHRDFGSKTDRITARKLGQQATRIYIILLISSFVILIIYLIAQQQFLTIDFEEPSFDIYNQLTKTYGEQLKCSCSLISSAYREFTQIEPRFHLICSSSFVSDEIITNLSLSLSVYEQRDYRQIISAHLQYLQGLCQISIQSVNNSIKQMLSTLFISKELLSKNNFDERINLFVNKIKFNVPDALNFILFLIRNINFGNAIVSTYNTNFKYIAPWNGVRAFLNTEAEIYDGDCSCALYLNCTSQAYFIQADSLEKIPIVGLKIGCTPSESFLSSTLECFYNQTCVNAIIEYTNYTYSLESLSITTTNQSQINRTIRELVENLFVDEWITTNNYSVYYQQCLPSICSYSYVQTFNLIYIISFILGLQGGLSIILKWICPKLIRFLVKIQKYRKKHSNSVQHSEQSVETASNMIDLTPPHSCSPIIKATLTGVIVIVLIIVLVIFSIYILRQKNTQTATTMTVSTDSTTIITTITTTTLATASYSSSTKIPICNPIFEFKSIVEIESYLTSPVIFIGDFNNDTRLDMGYIDDNSMTFYRKIIVLFANENGQLEESMTTILIKYQSESAFSTIADFNYDHLLDIAVLYYDSGFIDIFTGNGNGTFNEWITLSVENCETLNDISIFDINNDRYVDIVVTCIYPTSIIIIYFGNINGTFEEMKQLATFEDIPIASTVVADFNMDNHFDIATSNSRYKNIGVYLGRGDGTFNIPVMSFTGGGPQIFPMDIAVGDFNEDTILDIVLSYYLTSSISVMFGYGNGTFGDRIRLFSKIDFDSTPIVIADFNKDTHLDIAFITYSPYTVNIFSGYGNGQFDMTTIFSADYDIEYDRLIGCDLNGDGYQDIISSTNLGIHIFYNIGQCNNASIN